MLNKTILHYKIIEKLGEGGMGIVYKAEDTKLHRPVAIKVLPPHLLVSTDDRSRFNREARAAAALHHTNISTVFEINDHDGAPFIVMEYIEGQTLNHHIEKSPLKLQDAISIAIQVAEGLKAAHAKDIVHRDIKSSNIILGRENLAKILDFGLAKTSMSTKLTQMGSTIGTVAYMSPEQVSGKEVDSRTDLWSLGVVLYEMISGRLPFSAEYDQAIFYSILNEPHEPITGLRSGVPMELERIVNKAMAKNPDERYQQVNEMLVDLKNLKKNLSSLMKQTSTVNRVLYEDKQKRWKALIPWIITIIAVSVTITSLFLWRTTSITEQSPIRFVYNLPPDQTLEIEDVEFYGSALTISPDGSQFVYTATDSGGNTKLYRRPIGQFVSTPISGTEGANNPFFSPDGQWVGFFSGGWLKKVPTLGGMPINICEAKAGFGASWGTDETIIFSPTFTSGLLTVSAAGGSPKAITILNSQEGELSHRWPEILPDGKSVLFTIDTGMGGDAKHIAVYSMASGEQRILIKKGTDARFALNGYIIFIRGGSLLAAPFDIKRLEIIGSPVKILDGVKYSGAGGGQYSFSRNGTLVWIPASDLIPITPEFSSTVSFPKVAESSLLWVDRQGNTQPVLASPRGYWAPSFSPSGKHLAITIELDIFILELYRGALTRFTFEGRNHIPVWTPDGKRLTFSSAREEHPNIFWKMADGSGDAERLLTSKQHQDPGSWSPDGKILAYAELHPETNWDIWLLQLENQNQPEPFLQTNFNEYHPMISPDGQWLAYTSDESGQPEVYVRPFLAGGGKWLISTEGGHEPLWARNGSELFYRNTGKLMAVTIETGSTFIAGRPRLLFQREDEPSEMNPFGSPNYDVSPDGRFLIIKPNPSSPSTQINFTLNWFEDLKHRIPEDG